MLTGNTIFAGDSITVGLPSFVKVNGSKKLIAEVSRPTSWLLQQIQQAASSGGLSGFQNLVVLIGTNDIGGGRSVDSLVHDILTIWSIGRAHGLRVYAQTIPPVKDYAGFIQNFPAINSRRKAINAALGQAFVSGQGDGLIDLSTLMAVPSDPDKLAPAYDSGDHLHPRKDAHGALLTRAFEGVIAPPLASLVPSPVSSSEASTAPLLLTVGVCGIIAYLLTRKHWSTRNWR